VRSKQKRDHRLRSVAVASTASAGCVLKTSLSSIVIIIIIIIIIVVVVVVVVVVVIIIIVRVGCCPATSHYVMSQCS
jgi:flagellar basal body-associated protein FliL